MVLSTERTRKWRTKQKAAGLCTRCNNHLNNHKPGCLKLHNQKNNLLYKQRREIVIDLYGGNCACCQEHHKMFLTIGHIQNNGNIERKRLSSRSFYAKLAKAKTKLPDYQLLCWNCNCSKNALGECFHTHQFDKPISPQTKWYRRLKTEILKHYGGACACCGEDELWFLTIDHPNGGGRAERQRVGTGSRFYRWLKSQGLPSEYRVLCFNCNCAIGMYGQCPHDRLID